jgi:hypothetical protein
LSVRKFLINWSFVRVRCGPVSCAPFVFMQDIGILLMIIVYCHP